jgi:hypothetical protein
MRQLVFGLAIVLMAASSLRADLAAPWSTDTRSGEINLGRSQTPIAINVQAKVLDGQLIVGPSLDWGTVPVSSAGAERKSDVQLPAVPDSAALFLCGLGSLGVLQLGRSAKKMDFGALPGWYHSGAPKQIGYTFALDLDQIDFLPLCCFEQIGEFVLRFVRSHSEQRHLYDQHCLLSAILLRGPPCISS